MKEKTPVKINIAMKDGPLQRSIKQVLGALCNNVQFVDSPMDADLIIFEEVRDIEQGFNRKKTYAFLEVQRDSSRAAFPENVVTVPILETVAVLLPIVEKVRQKIEPTADEDHTPKETIPLLPDAKRILVVDDTPKHIASARKTLAGHRLTTVGGYEDAMNTLENEKFDVVLLDLNLPMSSKTLGQQAFKLGELVPYGLLLMLEAARQGAKLVAVVTDLGHHDNWVSAAFDHYSRFAFQIEGAKVLMLHARLIEGGSKDWASALARLQEE